MPKSRPEFWQPKLAGNRDRDTRNVQQLEALGWSVVTVWQCELAELQRIQVRLTEALDARKP
jgi:DNA mismatch endonuclease (patch repair protein)